MESIRGAFFAWEWPFMQKEGSLFSSACDAMDRSGRELPGEIGTTHFLILGREEGGEEIKRLSNVSLLEGFAREKLKKGKRQVKRQDAIRNRIKWIALTTRSDSPLSQ